MDDQFVRMLLAPHAAAAAPPSTPAADAAEISSPGQELTVDDPLESMVDIVSEALMAAEIVEPETSEPEDVQPSTPLVPLEDAAAAAALPNATEPEILWRPFCGASPSWAAAEKAVEESVKQQEEKAQMQFVSTIKQEMKRLEKTNVATEKAKLSLPPKAKKQDPKKELDDFEMSKLEAERQEKERESALEAASWRRLSRPLSNENETVMIDDDDDSTFFSCSEEDPVREAWMDLQATVTTLRLRREKWVHYLIHYRYTLHFAWIDMKSSKKTTIGGLIK